MRRRFRPTQLRPATNKNRRRECSDLGGSAEGRNSAARRTAERSGSKRSETSNEEVEEEGALALAAYLLALPAFVSPIWPQNRAGGAR